MKRSIIITILILLLISTFFSSSAFAESQADKYLGKRALCLDNVNIRETLILDDQTILFETYGGAVYINRLPIECFNLHYAGEFSYVTSIDRLCKLDTIKVVEEDSGHGSKCGLGIFIRIKGVKRLNDAVELLKNNGILEALVKEGAFETAFPLKKGK